MEVDGLSLTNVRLNVPESYLFLKGLIKVFLEEQEEDGVEK